MAEEDIYGNKKRYERFMNGLEILKEIPNGELGRGKRRYYCKNSENLEYFNKLHKVFETKDISFVRRNTLFNVLLIATYVIEKNLVQCAREEINDIAILGHKIKNTVKSKGDFINDLKHIWRLLLSKRSERVEVSQDSILISQFDEVIEKIRQSNDKILANK